MMIDLNDLPSPPWWALRRRISAYRLQRRYRRLFAATEWTVARGTDG